MVGLDFSAAFDHVNLEDLIFKLRQVGIGRSFLNILMEFLSIRKQQVVIDDHCGEWSNVISDVRQGCDLGPLEICLLLMQMMLL